MAARVMPVSSPSAMLASETGWCCLMGCLGSVRLLTHVVQHILFFLMNALQSPVVRNIFYFSAIFKLSQELIFFFFFQETPNTQWNRSYNYSSLLTAALDVGLHLGYTIVGHCWLLLGGLCTVNLSKCMFML